MLNPEPQIVNEYFENGIKIKVLQGFTEIIPRNSTLKSRTTLRHSTKYAFDEHNQKLRQWCSAKLGRTKALSDHSVYSVSWFEKRKQGQKSISNHEFNTTIYPAMQSVEKAEKLHEITLKYTGQLNAKPKNQKEEIQSP